MILVSVLSAVLSICPLVSAFTATPSTLIRSKTTTRSPVVTIVNAGGFEWEDPSEGQDQGVDNPFKNPELMESSSEEGMLIDPSRLLAPRLNGSNLYLVGMMGCGKSTIGNLLARRKTKEEKENFCDL